MYTVTQIDYFAISKSNALALVMAASEGGGVQRGENKAKVLLWKSTGDEQGFEGEECCMGEEDHGGEEGHTQRRVQRAKDLGNGWTQYFT